MKKQAIVSTNQHGRHAVTCSNRKGAQTKSVLVTHCWFAEKSQSDQE